MYSDSALALPQSHKTASVLGSGSNGLPLRTSNPSSRRHSRSKSSTSITAAATALGASIGLGSDHKSTGKRQPAAQSGTAVVAPLRPSTAVQRSENTARNTDVQDRQTKKRQTSPASKRRSSIAGSLVDRWSRSPSRDVKDGGRTHRRRSSLIQRLSLGESLSAVHTSGTAKTRSPPPRSPSGTRGGPDARRKSPDASPTKRRSMHSPPPPAGTKRQSSIAKLPPLSTLPSLPRLAFSPSSATGSPSTPLAPLGNPFSPDLKLSHDRAGSMNIEAAKSPPHNGADTLRSRISAHGIGQDGQQNNLLSTEESIPLLPAETYVSPSIYSAVHAQNRKRDKTPQTERDRSASESSVLGNNHSGGSGTTPTRRRERDKKTMLSRALQKANTAVLLDNAQNFEGAVDAYTEACDLLRQVMLKSSGEDDKRKLDAIRSTYTNRITELYELYPNLLQPSAERPLPARPPSIDSPTTLFHPDIVQSAGEVLSASGSAGLEATGLSSRHAVPPEPAREPPRQPAMHDTPSNAFSADTSRRLETSTSPEKQAKNQSAPSSTQDAQSSLNLSIPMEKGFMPAPLSPRYPPSPSREAPKPHDNSMPRMEHETLKEDKLDNNAWLDTINESGQSSVASSMHSATQQDGFDNVFNMTIDNDTQAEFDAAMDAAVEAAYDQGLAAYSEDGEILSPGDVVKTALRNVELAKERVRDVERETALESARHAGNQYGLQNGPAVPMPLMPVGDHRLAYDDEDDNADAEEEERLLDEMTKEYMLDDFDFGLQSKGALPRQSDGSEFSGSVWSNSRSSNRTTGNTAATTVSNLGSVAEGVQDNERVANKSLTALPTVEEIHSSNQAAVAAQKLPVSSSRPTTSSGISTKQMPNSKVVLDQPAPQPGVRSRRLSQNAKTLKIETSMPNSKLAPSTKKHDLTAPPNSTESMNHPRSLAATEVRAAPMPSKALLEPLPPFSHSPAETSVTISPATPSLTKSATNEIPPSPHMGMLGPKGSRLELRKNKSSMSLKSRGIPTSLSSPDLSDTASMGTVTPLSTTFSSSSLRSKGTLSTFLQSSGVSQTTISSHSTTPLPPLTPSYNQPYEASSIAFEGMQLAELDPASPSTTQPTSPYHPAYPPYSTPAAHVQNPPVALEPCPSSHLLRPFWLMRCMYHALAHPRGGYLTTKLFVPREIWRNKTVKLKGLDEKIANCDLLTAALHKLARVDMIDADAVLEEMQGLEAVLDQCQANLSRKLGNDVGVAGVGSLFREAATVIEEGDTGVGEGSSGLGGSGAGQSGSDAQTERRSGGDKSSKSSSYLATWRRLRSKNSTVGLAGLSAVGSGGAFGKKDSSGAALGSAQTAAGGSGGATEDGKSGPTMASVPMTSMSNIRFAKREIEKVDFGGGAPGSLMGYMGSLVRLCDAVQVIDTIARQVEDPGLKLSSPTHVGLELCTRHASEFFGFYVCRFVLADVGIMLDKFLKRSTEWVLV